MAKVKDVSILLQDLDQCVATLSDISRSLNQAFTIKPDKPTRTVVKEHVVGLEDVRGVLADKAAAGYTAQIREIICSFGVEKLSDVDPKNYPALLDRVEGLK